MQILDNDILEKSWGKWVISQKKDLIDRRNGMPLAFRYCTKWDVMEEFEDWLFEHGGRIRQINKKKYIEFVCDEDALAFLLSL